MRHGCLTLQIFPDHVIYVILDVAVRQQVGILGLVVLFLVGLKLCVQNPQPVTELVLNGHPGTAQNWIEGPMSCCEGVPVTKGLALV